MAWCESHDRSFRHRHEREFAAAGKAINDKVRLYARIGGALVDAKTSGIDPFVAIEAIMPWDQFAETVKDAEKLARTEDFDHLVLVGAHYQQLRRYAPVFLDTFEFSGAPAAQGVPDAIQTLRTMNSTSSRKMPADAPISFVRKRWQPLVFVDGGIDRKFYEFMRGGRTEEQLTRR
ncbi:hypothetical protein OKW41_005189 [Paraburkholderia sp. UCT70]